MKRSIKIQGLLALMVFFMLPFLCGAKAKADSTVEVGKSIILTDSNMNNGTGFIKTWSSSDTSIAAVSGSGETATVFGRKEGTVTITCYTDSWVTRPWFQWTGPYASDGYWTTKTDHSYTTRYYTVRVEAGMDGVEFSRETLTMTVGEQQTLSVTANPSGAVINTRNFRSSDITVASVDLSGRVTAKKAGTATITVTVNGKYTASCQIIVREESQGNTGGQNGGNQQNNNSQNTSGNQGHNQQTGPNANGQNHNGGQSNNGQTNNGQNKPGNQNNAASSAKLVLSKKTVTLSVGKKLRLTARQNGKRVNPTYTSGNKKRVTVSKNGTLTAKACGAVKIKAKASNGKTAYCTVKVVPRQMTSLKASRKNKTVTLTWKKLKNISGYKIYRAAKANGKYKAVKTLSASKTKLTLKNQKKGTSYYKICAYKKVGGKTYLGTKSKAVKVTVR